jgi:hypothetical protein
MAEGRQLYDALSRSQEALSASNFREVKFVASKDVAKAPIAIVVDKYDIVWYGVAVLEGDLQKFPSSFSLRILVISFALPPRALSLLGRPPK